MNIFKHVSRFSACLFYRRSQFQVRQLANIFVFRAGPRLRISDIITAEKPGDNEDTSMPLDAFIQQEVPCSSWYVSQISLVTPDAPLSRMLQPPTVVHDLEQKPLSEILGGPISSQRPRHNDEFFCWALLDHVAQFPYTHPDGMAPATKEFEVWHVSIQKQYALLLHQRKVQEDQVLAWRRCIQAAPRSEHESNEWIRLDSQGHKQIDAIHAMQMELRCTEKEYNKTVRKVTDFREEQKWLRKAFHRTVARCLEEGNAAISVPVQRLRGGKCLRPVLTPLHQSSKRKAEGEYRRHASIREQFGRVFVDGQRKQRKISQSASTSIIYNLFILRNSDQDIDSADNATFKVSSIDGWQLVEFESNNDAIHIQDIPQPENATHTDADTRTSEPSSRALEVSAPSIGDIETTLSHSYVLQELESLGTVVDAMQLELNNVMHVRNNIVAALQQNVVASRPLTVYDVATAIPQTGIDYESLVRKLAERVPDTITGMKMLRMLIDEAGSFDEKASMVYK